MQPHPTWDLFEQWRADDVVSDGIVAYTERAANIAGLDEPRRIVVGRITDRFLSVVGVLPAIGRPFNAGDFRAGHDDVALITDALWRRQFRAVPDIVGRALTLDDRRYIVIGVQRCWCRSSEIREP